MRLFFDQEPVLAADCLSKYPEKEFASPTRSTVPLIEALRHGSPPSFLSDLLVRARMAGEKLHLEYRVRPARGRGNSSHTDLMVTDSGPPQRALAIEAKWTEPRYERVSKWLCRGTSVKNRQEVLEGWLEAIAGHTGARIDSQNCGDLAYQMVHRAASAAIASGTGGQPAMAYLIFQTAGDDAGKGNPRLNPYRDDLRRFRSIIGSPEAFPFFLVSVAIQPTGAFEAISCLSKGRPATREAVRGALREAGSPLFTFDSPAIESI